MSAFRFPYQRISSPLASEIARFKHYPIKTLALANNSSFIKTEGYIDTGSQWCLFNHFFAKHLGIKDFTDTKIKVPLAGIGGRQQGNMAYFHELNLCIFKDNTKLDRGNAWKIKTMLGFLENEIGFAGILGVFGFLDQFIFKTNIPEGYFELTPVFDVAD